MLNTALQSKAKQVIDILFPEWSEEAKQNYLNAYEVVLRIRAKKAQKEGLHAN